MISVSYPTLYLSALNNARKVPKAHEEQWLEIGHHSRFGQIMQSACVLKDKSSIPGSPTNSAEEGCCHASVKIACAITDNGQTFISELIAWTCI